MYDKYYDFESFKGFSMTYEKLLFIDDLITKVIEENEIKRIINIFLDLDETIARVSLDPNIKYDNMHQIEIQKNDIRVTEKYTFAIRPFLYFFLQQISKFANIYIFSAGVKNYVDTIVDIIDFNNEFIKGRYYRSSTIGKYYRKNLTKIGFKNENSILIDNNLLSFTLEANGIIIPDFDCMFKKYDYVLLDLIFPLLHSSLGNIQNGFKLLKDEYKLNKKYIKMIDNI